MNRDFVLFGTVKPRAGRLYMNFGCSDCHRSHDSSEVIFHSLRKKLIIFLAYCEFSQRDFVVIGAEENDSQPQPSTAAEFE
jgi:hypothetical protein